MADIIEESQEGVDPIGPKKDREEILKSELADCASANNVNNAASAGQGSNLNHMC
jgi:hypothetical protein